MNDGTVRIAIEKDSSLCTHFHKADGFSPWTVVEVPQELWERYKEAQRVLMELENQIEMLPAVNR